MVKIKIKISKKAYAKATAEQAKKTAKILKKRKAKKKKAKKKPKIVIKTKKKAKKKPVAKKPDTFAKKTVLMAPGTKHLRELIGAFAAPDMSDAAHMARRKELAKLGFWDTKMARTKYPSERVPYDQYKRKLYEFHKVMTKEMPAYEKLEPTEILVRRKSGKGGLAFVGTHKQGEAIYAFHRWLDIKSRKKKKFAGTYYHRKKGFHGA